MFLSGQPTSTSIFSQPPPLVEEDLGEKKNLSFVVFLKHFFFQPPLSEKSRHDLLRLSPTASPHLTFLQFKGFTLWFQLTAGKNVSSSRRLPYSQALK